MPIDISVLAANLPCSVRNWNASTSLLYDSPKFPAVIEVNLHGLSEYPYAHPQSQITSWLKFCENCFDALSTFRLTFPITDQDDASPTGYRHSVMVWTEACDRHFDFEGDIEVMGQSGGNEETWVWEAPLGRKFKALARARAKNSSFSN